MASLIERREPFPLNESLSFKGKTVLVTGAASGIGQAIAARFAEGGANLLLLDRNEQGLQKIIPELSKNDGSTFHLPYQIDLSAKEQIDQFWDKVGTPPDILINNAGIYPEQDFLKLSEPDLKKVMDINYQSVVWMCQNFIRSRGKNGGTIINISSIEAILPLKEHLAPYGGSKAAVLSLTRSLARDYGKRGFRVNAILPGAIRTPGTESMAIKAIKNLRFDLIKTGLVFQQRLALGRWGKPDEVAKAAVFLASDLSSYVQGVALPVDGGFLSS